MRVTFAGNARSDETHTLNAQNMIFVIFYDLSRSRSHTYKLGNLTYIQVFLDSEDKGSSMKKKS